MLNSGRLKDRPGFRRGARPRHHSPARLGRARDWFLEERCLLAAVPGQVEFPLAPTNTFGKYNTVGNLSDVLFTGASSAPYQKTITITNSSDKVMFAFLEAENTHQSLAGPPVDYTGTASYDPYDPLNQEYRGYVGTTDGTNDDAGIPPHTSITVTVPLVFWDSGRINISTDGPDQFTTYQAPDLNQAGTPAGAPFNYLNADPQGIFFGKITTTGGQSRLNFTPIYNSFVGGEPSTANWKSPVSSGLFKSGQTCLVTGPGMSAQTVTIDPSHPDYVTLPTTVTAPPTTVGQYTFTIQTDPGNPANTNPVTISSTGRFIQTGLPLTTQGSAGTTNGVVLWYHSLVGQQPNNLAPFQLTELTFRGTFYDATKNPGTDFAALLNSNDYAGAINNLADYDVSYVDSVNLPVAMEATDASVGNTGTVAPFGWIGSGMTVEAFQGALQALASNNKAGGGNTNGLGTYFGGQGYPSYLPLATGDLKLPSGQNLFLQGPSSAGSVSDIHFVKTFPDGSVINQPLLELTSGGTDPTTWAIGLNPNHATEGVNLGLNTDDASAYTIENFLTKSGTTYDVTYVDGGVTKLAGVVKGLYFAPDGTTLLGVKLDRAAPQGLPSTTVFTFTRDLQDYAGGAIAGLWYSWAQYYANHVTSSPLPDAPGTLTGSVLKLDDPAPNLVPGMAVTSGTDLPPGCIILSISSDHKTIQLSTVATGNPKTFSFAKPNFGTIVGFDATRTPLVNLSFGTVADKAHALAFAQAVYTAMSAWSVSVPAGTPNAWSPLLANIIGGNTGPAFLAHADPAVATFLTNVTKSLQRGVPDFTSPQYADQALWYPDPALPTGGLSYNAFNLNPVVWFIHQKLGAIVYAFSLDDELGNVNAGGATNVGIDIGGLDGFANFNQDQYSNTSNFGIVTSPAGPTQVRSSEVQATAPNLNAKLFPFNPNDKTPGTMVNGPGVAVGTSLQFLTPSLTLNNPLSKSSSNPMFSFFGAPIFTGTVLGKNQAADTIVLGVKDASGNFPEEAIAAYNSLLKMQPWENIQVNGEGIAPPQFGSTNPTRVTIKNVTRTANAITVQLTSDLNPALVSQPGASYGYTFGDAALGLLRDTGFEWADVSALTGKFNHGAQLTQNTRDWTFTDSTTPGKSWFAGIAFDNTSTYTTLNPPAPQGLQVGFIQGNSTISQDFVAGVGEYKLSLSAAQSVKFPSPQTLAVLVDGVQVATIPPKGKDYQSFTIQFHLTTAGQHTMTLKGTQASDGTVLIDETSVSPVSALGAPAPPTLAPIPNQLVVDGSTDTFTAHASGLSSPLTFSLAPRAPGGARIDPDTGVFTWTPTTPGTYSATIRATDHSVPPLVASQTFTITVSDVAPSVTFGRPPAAVQGTAFSDRGSFSSPVSGSFTATVDYGDGSGVHPLTVNPDKTFVLNHVYTLPGTFIMTVTVSDQFGGIGTGKLTVKVASSTSVKPPPSGFGAGRDAFVEVLYTEILGREPEPGGLRYWSQRLASKVPLRTVASEIWRSPEHQVLVRQGSAPSFTLARAFADALQAGRKAARLSSR